jgi:hypothetical protein
LQSVELGRDGVERHRLGRCVGEGRRGVETVDGGRTMLHWRRMIAARESGPRNAWAALMLTLKHDNAVKVGVDEVENRVLVVKLLGLEQMQEHAAVEGEFSHEHLCAGGGSEG